MIRSFVSAFSVGFLLATPTLSDTDLHVAVPRADTPVAAFADESPLRSVVRGVARIDILYPDDKTGYCTAVIVGPDHVLAPDFCVSDSGERQAKKVQVLLDYIDAEAPDTVRTVVLDPVPVAVSASQHLSLLRRADQTSAFEADRVARLQAGAPETGTVLFLAAHPRGAAMQISATETCHVMPPLKDNAALIHGCATGEGSSGGALFHAASGEIVGLHLSSDRNEGHGLGAASVAILDAFPQIAE